MKVIKEKRHDVPGFLYRFVTISKIQNNIGRRITLIATLPFFMIFNCLAILPMLAVAFVFNNIALFDTVIIRWNKPLDDSELKD